LFRLVFAHESVALLGHAISPNLVNSTSVKVGVTKGHVALALLKQIWIIDDLSTVCPYPGHVWFVRRTANLNHSDGRNKG